MRGEIQVGRGSVRAAVSLMLLLLGAACSEDPTFTPSDLKRIALQPSEAPEGTRYWEETSGPQGYEIFAKDEGAARAAAAEGWQAGYASIFVQDGYQLDDQETAPSDVLFVGSYVWLFREADQAGVDLMEYISGYAKERRIKRLSTEGLGEGAFGGRGTYSDDEGGQPWLAYAWRVGNMNFLLSVQGPMSVSAARALAEMMNSRAEG